MPTTAVLPTFLSAATSTSSTKSGGSSAVLILMLVAVGGFLLLNSRNRQKRARAQQASFEPGSQVMTTSGIYGRLLRVEDDVAYLEVAAGVELRFARQAIARVVSAPADGLPEALPESLPESHPDRRPDDPEGPAV